jgi:hypothetical protein
MTIKKLITIFFLLGLSASAQDTKYIRLVGFDPVLEEQVKFQISSRLRKHFNYKFVKTLANTGGTVIIYDDEYPKCFNTIFGYIYKSQMERLELNQIVINRTCINYYGGINKINAFFNAINHEYFCHALLRIKGHLPDDGTVNLCNSNLSTGKIYFTKKDVNYILEYKE